MKAVIRSVSVALLVAATPAMAHHMAADIVDEEIYAMIDSLVADTPHAELELTELGSGMNVLTISTDSVDAMSDLLDDGGLGYIEELDGTTYISMDIAENGSAVLTVQQYPSP